MSYDFNNRKIYRKKRGFTQEQIAEYLGVSRQAVAKWERGDTMPDVENIVALSDIYKVTVDELVKNLAAQDDNSESKKHLFGITRVNDKGQITLPKKCRDVFGIHNGDALLLLGDEDRGIALVKVSEIFEN